VETIHNIYSSIINSFRQQKNTKLQESIYKSLRAITDYYQQLYCHHAAKEEEGEGPPQKSTINKTEGQ
jgi:hypothetical protein